MHAALCLDLTPSAENIGWQPDEKAPYQWIAMDIHPGRIYKHLTTSFVYVSAVYLYNTHLDIHPFEMYFV